MSDNPTTPFTNLVTFARRCAANASMRFAQANGKRRSRGELREQVTPQELKLNELVSECRKAWGQTGYPAPEVEFRCTTTGLPVVCGYGLLGALVHHNLPARRWKELQRMMTGRGNAE